MYHQKITSTLISHRRDQDANANIIIITVINEDMAALKQAYLLKISGGVGIFLPSFPRV